MRKRYSEMRKSKDYCKHRKPLKHLELADLTCFLFYRIIHVDRRLGLGWESWNRKTNLFQFAKRGMMSTLTWVVGLLGGTKFWIYFEISYCQEVLLTDCEVEGEKICQNYSNVFRQVIPLINNEKSIRGIGLRSTWVQFRKHICMNM